MWIIIEPKILYMILSTTMIKIKTSLTKKIQKNCKIQKCTSEILFIKMRILKYLFIKHVRIGGHHFLYMSVTGVNIGQRLFVMRFYPTCSLRALRMFVIFGLPKICPKNIWKLHKKHSIKVAKSGIISLFLCFFLPVAFRVF